MPRTARDTTRVILPITDPYVVHHGALGSFATVYVERSREPSTTCASGSPRCPASSSCCRAPPPAPASSCPRTASAISWSFRAAHRHRHAPLAPRPVGARRAAALARRHLRAARAADRQPPRAPSCRRGAGATSTRSTSPSTILHEACMTHSPEHVDRTPRERNRRRSARSDAHRRRARRRRRARSRSATRTRAKSSAPCRRRASTTSAARSRSRAHTSRG